MARARTQYKCRSCGYISASYLGRCPNCGAWNQFEKESQEVRQTSTKATPAALMASVGAKEAVKMSTVKAEKKSGS